MNPAVVAKFSQAAQQSISRVQVTDSVRLGGYAGSCVTAVGTAAMLCLVGSVGWPVLLGLAVATPVLAVGSQFAINAWVPDSTQDMIMGLVRKAKCITSGIPALPAPAATTTTVTAPEAAAIAVIAAHTDNPVAPAATVTLAK